MKFIKEYSGVVALVILAIMGVANVLPKEAVTQTFGAVTPSTTTASYATESTGAPIFVLGNALTGPNSTGATNYTGYIATQGYRQTATSGTTTPCAILNPFTGTSTIESFSFNETTATSSAVSWVLGTSTTAYATSSSLMSSAIAASAQGTLSYLPVTNGNIVGPGLYVLLGTGLGTANTVGPNTGGVVMAGTCSAVFQSI